MRTSKLIDQARPFIRSAAPFLMYVSGTLAD